MNQPTSIQPPARLIAVVAIAWSLFQLSLPQFLLLNADYVRAIHLAFALALVYLSYPARTNRRDAALHAESPTPVRMGGGQMILAGCAAAAALYLAIDQAGIAERMGRPSSLDLAVGSLLIVLLLEAARRSLGLALPVIAGSFILLSFFSEHLPERIAFKNATFGKMVSKLSLTSEGIYGVPLDVAASIVFLFVLFGAMLEKAGGGKYFIDLSYSLLGRYRGGPGKAAVMASGLTGMISGSSIANTVTTGTFTIPLMKKAGYPAIKAGAIEVAASTNGQLMPPIMGAAAFIIAEYCNLPYVEVVRAAFIPAFISYLALIYIVHLEAVKLGLKPVASEELPPFGQTFRGGIHFFIPIFFLLYQLVVVRRSATLAVYQAIIVLVILMAARHVIRALRGTAPWKSSAVEFAHEVGASLITGARNMMGIGVAVAAAGIIVGVVTLGLGNAMTELIGWLSGGRLIPLLLITAVVSLILGMGLPTTANYIVMASLTAPAIVALSGSAGLVVPLIAAHLFVFYFGILSDDTPPVGLAAYAAAAISGADPIRTGIQGFIYDLRTAILPFLFIFNTDLLLINIDSWARILSIFAASTIAMFAFASVLEGHMIRKNRWYETMILLLVVPMIMCPTIMERFMTIDHLVWYVVGSFLFAGVYAWQRHDRRTLS
jgi:TRAP transporter 4TM/12TM fusion protein